MRFTCEYCLNMAKTSVVVVGVIVILVQGFLHYYFCCFPRVAGG